MLISFKRGRAHAGDADATLDWMRFDKESNRKLSQGTLAKVKGEIMQMGEWVRFPNGDIANHVDAQKTGVLRSGLCVVRSEDGGRTFGPVTRLGLVDSVEYGSSSIGKKCVERYTTAQEGNQIHEAHPHAPHRPSLSD